MAESLNTLILIQRIQQGDQSAINELLHRYQARILATVRIRLGTMLRAKMESMDVVQDVMIEALRRVMTVKFTSDGAFMAYMNKIVESEVRDHARHWKAGKRDAKKEVPLKNARSSDAGNPFNEIGARSALTPSKVLIRQEQFALLEPAMDRLASQSEEYRDLILAAEYEGLTDTEIATERGSTPDAVRMRVKRAKIALAKIYKDLDKGR